MTYHYRPNEDGSVTLITETGGEHTFDPDQFPNLERPLDEIEGIINGPAKQRTPVTDEHR